MRQANLGKSIRKLNKNQSGLNGKKVGEQGMKNKYDLVSKKGKVISSLLAFVLALTVSLLLNKGFLQHKMFGTWEVTAASGAEVTGINPQKVTISSQHIKFDGEEAVFIKYGSKSNRKNFGRKDIQGDLMYFFMKKDSTYEKTDFYDYALIYSRKTPTIMTLLVYDEDNLEGMYSLSKIGGEAHD